tara:strand:- start:1065 stop:1658 length:594 start_codon:yes stop_codon:yes gene_type:complete
MGKYTANDNRSMQLNDNNDRYWSSRGIDDFIYDENTTDSTRRNKIMFIEINNKLINLSYVQTVRTEVNKVDVKRHTRENEYDSRVKSILIEIIPEFTITFVAEHWEEKVTIRASINNPDDICRAQWPDRGSYCDFNYSSYIPDVCLNSENKLSIATIVHEDENFDFGIVKKEIELSSHGLTHAFIKKLCKQHNPDQK